MIDKISDYIARLVTVLVSIAVYVVLPFFCIVYLFITVLGRHELKADRQPEPTAYVFRTQELQVDSIEDEIIRSLGSVELSSQRSLLMDDHIERTETVYITRTGEKYHKSGCSYLKSKIPISLEDAIDDGYTPCSRCY